MEKEEDLSEVTVSSEDFAQPENSSADQSISERMPPATDSEVITRDTRRIEPRPEEVSSGTTIPRGSVEDPVRGKIKGPRAKKSRQATTVTNGADPPLPRRPGLRPKPTPPSRLMRTSTRFEDEPSSGRE